VNLPPPLWKASVVLKKEEAADVAAAFELTGPQAVLIAEEPFTDKSTVETIYLLQCAKTGTTPFEPAKRSSRMR
jgi:hypothetical protein